MKPVLALALLTLAWQSVTAAEARDLSLDAHLSYGYSAAASTSTQQIIRLVPGFRIDFSPRTRVVLEGRLHLDFADQLEPGKADAQSYSSLSRPAVIDNLGTAEIRDAYVESTLDNGLLRLGKQQVVWGKLDGLKVLDVLNPQNFREFILDDFSESRISLWSAYLDVTLGAWRTEFALIPDNTGHAVPTRGAWFELTAPRYRFGASPGDPAVPVVTHRESVGFSSSAYAMRLSREVGAFELGAIAYSGLDHEPLGRLIDNGGGTTVEQFYERRDVFGLSAETSFSSFALRAEVAMQPDRKFNTRTPGALSTVELDQLRAGIGVDIDGPWNTFINIQYLHDDIRDAPRSLVSPDRERIVTAFLRRSFNYDAIELIARMYHSLDFDDEMYSVALEFSFGDSTRLEFAANAFSGSPTGIFGQFADRDRVTIGLTHTF
jgi:hypothetical protein